MAENEQTVKNPYELNEPPKPEWLDSAIEKWLSKLDFVILEKKLSEKKEQIDLKFTDKTAKLDFVMRNVRDVLNKNGLFVEFNLEYYAYALELYRVWLKFRPSVWKWKVDWYRELKIIAQKWTNRKLNKEIMKQIAIRLNCEDIIQFL